MGDHIQIGTDTSREYKMVVGVSSGNTYTVEPMIRRTDFVGLEVEYNNPTGVFMLSQDDFARWNIRSKAYLSDLNFEFIEAFT